jgi:hypothetical protein
MRFLLSEYINLLKEDKELDTLLTDLLVGMKFTTISKPMKGRQFGVDISAIGIDPEDGIKKVFLFAVKQGNLTRTTWDGDVNAIRSTLNQIKDEFISVRNATITFFTNMSFNAFDNIGTGNKIALTPRIIGWKISGHSSHHCNVIKERYLAN